MITEWPYWWCCLKPSWRDMLNFMGTFSASPDPIVLRSVYDTNFEAFIGPKISWLYDWFNTAFGVTFTSIDIPPFGVLEVANWDLGNYLSFKLWQTDDRYACPVPCPYTSGWFVLP